ncbi:MAG: branched-chain amino acid ABC transporter permease [Nitrospirae bacterium]|nr:MAG: branched-chain amino acid ABC transporter permease [Nitrospirota bacterium]
MLPIYTYLIFSVLKPLLFLLKSSVFVQQVINGLTVGGVYALIALGYTMVYGILELINFAHGEIYMLGAYLGIIFLGFFTAIGLTSFSLPLSLFLAFILSIIFCSSYGYTMEKIAYKPLRNAPRLSPLISAIGVSIFLQNYVMLTQGATDKVFPHIVENAGLEIGGVSVTYIQLFIITVSVLMMLSLHIFITRTRMGKAMRAVAQDKTMASLVGINIDTVISVTFVIGSGLAAVAGLMVASYYGLVNYSIGYIAGIKAFTAAVLGGIGSIPGAMFGGIFLGLIESLSAAYISPEYKDAYAFIILIIILLIKPSGLFGKSQEEKV